MKSKGFHITSFLKGHVNSTVMGVTGKVKECYKGKAVMVGTVNYTECGEVKTSPVTVFYLVHVSHLTKGKYFELKNIKCATDGTHYFFDCSEAFVTPAKMPEQDTAISEKLISRLNKGREGSLYATPAEKKVIRALAKKLEVSNNKQRAWDSFKQKVLSGQTVRMKDMKPFGHIVLSRRVLEGMEWKGRQPSYEFFLDIQFLSNQLPETRDHLAEAYISGKRHVTCHGTISTVNPDKFCIMKARLSDGYSFKEREHSWVKCTSSSSLKKGAEVSFRAEIVPYFSVSHGTPRISFCMSNAVMM